MTERPFAGAEPGAEIEVRAAFHDEAGTVLFEEVAQNGKPWVRRPDGNGGYIANAEGVRRVLWNLPRLRAHLADGRRAGPVYVTEGTSDARALEAHLAAQGLPGVVTTNAFGALSWLPEHTEALTGAPEVIATVDNDDAGRKRAALLERELGPVVEELRVLRTPLEHKGADLRDHLAAGKGLEELVPFEEAPSEEGEQLAGVRIVPLDEFADTDEEGEEAILGDADNAVIPEAGDGMFYGDGGAGKTTLAVDLACHLAAGDDWHGIRVPRPLRVLIIENEGPRARFRRKLRRKRDAWAGSPLGDRISVLETPWARFSFADERWRVFLADHVREEEIDVVVVGPVASAGMEAAGTIQDVRAFLALVDDVRQRSGRRLAVLLVHHENKGGKVSGAWEGVGDTLVHVQRQGHGRLRLHWQKTRWASDYHDTTLQLLWAEGDSFEVEEKEELDEEALAEQIVAYIGENPGTAWGKVEKATPGINRQARMEVRDGLFAAGRIVNVRRKRGEPEVALDHLEEATAAHLYLADDPTIRQLLPEPGAVREQSAPPGGERASSSTAPCSPPLKGEQGEQEQSVPPAPDLFNDAGEAGREEPPDDDIPW